MRKNIVAAVIGILTAGVTYVNAQTNTNTSGGSFWVQNVSFTLQAQTPSGKRVISTKDIIADLSGSTITNASGGTGGITTTNSVTVTNAPIFALASGDYTNTASFTNNVVITFTNGTSTTNPVVSTRTSTNPPTFTFQNTAHTSTSNETVNVFTNGGLPLGTLTVVLVTTNNAAGPVFTVTGTSTSGGSGGSNVIITLPTFAKNAKLIVKKESPSGPATATNSTSPGAFFVRVGTAKTHTDTDVSGAFEQSDTTSFTTTKGKTTSVFNDFNFAYKGKSAFDARGVGKTDFGTSKGAEQRRTFQSTIGGSGSQSNASPFTVTGKYNITGGAVEQ